MSYADGMAALSLDAPPRIPRTEYSAEVHWDLVRCVTGIPVDHRSEASVQQRASQEFVRQWNYDFVWSVLIGGDIFGDLRTNMGHAQYAAGAVDFDPSQSCPFQDPEEVLRFDPWAAFGKKDQRSLTEAFEEHYRRQCAKHQDAVNMTGVYVTMFSGFIDLFGWEMLLLAAGVDSKRFGQTADRYASWMQQYFHALAEADVPVVMVHDDIAWTEGPILHPQWYRTFLFPNYGRLLQPLLDSGKKILFTSDGNYLEFIDDVAAAGVHGFVLEPCTDLAVVAEKYGQTHAIVGNVDTRVLLSGSRSQIRQEVERCLDIGRNCPGYFLAVGNHIPANTPVENALYYNEVYEELQWRR